MAIEVRFCPAALIECGGDAVAHATVCDGESLRITCCSAVLLDGASRRRTARSVHTRCVARNAGAGLLSQVATRVSRRLAIKAEAQGGRKTWQEEEEDEPDVEMQTDDVVVAPRKRSRAQLKQEQQVDHPPHVIPH